MAEKNVKFYKTKDGTIVYCKDEVARQQIEQLQGIWEAIEELPDGQAVSAQVAIHTTEIAALQNGKANINGSYDSMTVGMAKNVEATSEISGTSLYRPTAGNADIAEGVAKVLKIWGNTVPWNQLAPLPSEWKFYNGAYVTLQADDENRTLTITNKTNDGIRGDNSMVMLKNSLSINGHKCYISFYHSASYAPNKIVLDVNNTYYGEVSNDVDTWELSEMIVPLTNVPDFNFFIKQEGSGGIYGTIPAQGSYKLKDIMCFDLTLKFGAGNEPSSVAEFKTWLLNDIGKQNWYPTNPGKLLAAKLLGLKNVWLNQWDEEWELGEIGAADGQNYPASNQIRSKNYISVFPATEYYFKGGAAGIEARFYRSDKSYIGYVDFNGSGVNNDSVFKTPADCSYMRFALQSTYGTTYNHDICINLHYTNGRDGEYEPYEEHQYNFDTSKVYGKLNGEGNYVQVFPNGMMGAKAIFDILDIQERKAYIRTNLVNLSEISYTYSGIYFIGSLSVAGDGTANCIVNRKYKTTSLALLSQNDNPGLGLGTANFYIRDTDYSTAESLKASLSDTYLCYARQTPLVYTDLVYRDNGVDTPIDALNILVSNYGTEEQIVESPTNGEPNSCAATLDILYGVNAADFMDAANNGAFVSKASLDALCNTLGSALGGTLTSTWNSAEGHYDFTFTPATRQIENPENNE